MIVGDEQANVRERPFSIVCLSPQDWRTALPTNRQQIMLRAARRGHPVLFVETGYFVGRHLWALLRGPNRRSLLRRLLVTERIDDGIRVRKAINLLPWGLSSRVANRVNWRVTAWLLRRRARSLPYPVVLWIYDPAAARAAGACGEQLAVYDCVDDYVEQATSARRRSFVAASDRLAVQRSRLVFASSRAMYERQRHHNPATYHVPNVGDFEHFKGAADRAIVSPEVAALPRPVVGFSGNFLFSKVDLDLLERIALARPDWTLLLVGPAGETASTLQKVTALPNVIWLGSKPYADLPRYVAAFDIGLIPYVSNAYTRSCFPLKLYEYLAAGKPVVATGLPELSGMEPDVLLVDGHPAAVVEAVEKLLDLREREDQTRRMELASRNTWETRTEQLLGLIEDELAG